MKIVVIGGTGLIGSKLVTRLEEAGHEALAAAPNTGVNTITGEGLAEALRGAEVLVDVSNSPSFEEQAVLTFFQTSTTNLLEAARAAGVAHYVALSVVGTDRLDSGYMRAKVAQEQLIAGGGVPYSLVHATQFFEFVGSMAADATQDDGAIHLAPVRIQPIAADDVAAQVGRTAVGAPVNGTVTVAGPEEFRLDEFIQIGLAGTGDARPIISDPAARYFGAPLTEWSLVPGDGTAPSRTSPAKGELRFSQWLSENVVRR